MMMAPSPYSVELCAAAAGLVLVLQTSSSSAAEVCWDDEGSRFCPDGYVCCEYRRCCRVFSTPFIVGVVCGCAAVLVLLVSFCCYFYMRRSNQRQVPHIFIPPRPLRNNLQYGSIIGVNGQGQQVIQLQSQLLTYLTPQERDVAPPPRQ